MTPDAAVLSRTIKAESDALGLFVELLREEQQSLVRGDIEQTSAFSQAKSTRLFELKRLADERQALLLRKGLPADRPGMQRLLDSLGSDAAALRMAWQQLLVVTRTARDLNETNGTLIRTRLNGAQRALNVLLSAANIAGAYNNDGSTLCFRAPQRLAVA